MRLESIEVTNWRSISACRLDLSADVTIIIGENSSGKTGLLNAFVWCLYEQTTPGFLKPDDLCNHKAKLELGQGEEATTEVRVSFRHGVGEAESLYEARRRLTVTRTGPGINDFDVGQPQLTLNIQPRNPSRHAETVSGENAKQKIQGIIPASLNPYFFFPAENIGHSVSATDVRAASVKDAASVLLGLKRYEVADAVIKAALHLPKLKEKASNDLEIRKAQEAREEARRKHEDACAELAELGEGIARLEVLQGEAEEAVKRVEAARELFEERNDIKEEYEQASRDANACADRRRQVLIDGCFSLFGAKVLTKAREVLDRAKSDDKIPPRVSAGLLDELIGNSETCICGQPITDAERRTLEERRRGVVDDIVAESASNVWARVSDRCDQLADLPAEGAPYALLERANVALADASQAMATSRLKLNEFDLDNPGVGGQLESDPFGAYQSHTGKLEKLKSDQRDLRGEVERLNRERRDADNKCAKLQKKRGEADEVSNARRVLTSVEEAVEDVQDVLRDGARRDVERAMNKIVSEVLLREYTIRLTPDFEIETIQKGVDSGGSSSDQAWITFAFAGAITGLIDAYDRKVGNMNEAGAIELEPGEGYPLVLDAPFSPFGEGYSIEFGERLTGLAPQSILMVREDVLDYLKPVLDAGAAKVRAYLMCFHGPQKVATKEIEWRDGSSRVYVRPSDDPRYVDTVVEELPV